MPKENQSPSQERNPWGPEYKSQLGQDRFVDSALRSKRNGYFVDIGAAHPVDINNTHFLEKKLNWSGISIDMGPENPHCHIPNRTNTTKEEYTKSWENERSTPLICADALQIDYKKLFKENNVPAIVDYLSLDLEPADVTFECLLKIPFDEYQFKVITFEHDYYRNPSENIKFVQLAQSILSNHGLHAVAFDRQFPMGGYDLNKIMVQEDWFVNRDLILANDR
mgnify:CR=1 FL=1